MLVEIAALALVVTVVVKVSTVTAGLLTTTVYWALELIVSNERREVEVVTILVTFTTRPVALSFPNEAYIAS